MNCSQAKTIPIQDYLQKNGINPCKSQGCNFWYISPFRDESKPSFKVNTVKNVWFDYGTAAVKPGGTIIDLVMMLHKCTLQEALKILDSQANTHSFFLSPAKERTTPNKTATTPIIDKVKPLEYFVLFKYVMSRSISLETAKMYLSEVFYRENDKRYFGLALQNVKKGYAIRNSVFKRNLGETSISLIAGKIYNELDIVEGMFDFLSLLELRNSIDLVRDVLILNSTSNTGQAIEYIDKYDDVYLYLNNDPAGVAAVQKIKSTFPGKKIIDKSKLYCGSNDLNEYLCKQRT